MMKKNTVSIILLVQINNKQYPANATRNPIIIVSFLLRISIIMTVINIPGISEALAHKMLT